MRLWLIITLLPTVVFANYMGNIGTPAIHGSVSLNPFFSVSSGYVYDVTRNREFVSAGGDIKTFDTCSNFNVTSIAIMRRLEFYTLCGSSYESLRWMEVLLSTDKQEAQTKKYISSKKHFSYGIGTKVILLQFATTIFGINIQYFSFPCVHYINDIIENLHLPFLDERFDFNDSCVCYNEWDISIGIATTVACLVPYVATKYVASQIDIMNDHNVLGSYKNSHSWGVVAGCSFNIGIFHFNAEMRRYNETSVSFQVSSSF